MSQYVSIINLRLYGLFGRDLIDDLSIKRPFPKQNIVIKTTIIGPGRFGGVTVFSYFSQ